MKRHCKHLIMTCLLMSLFLNLFPSMKVCAASFTVSATNNGNGTTTATVSGQVVGMFTLSGGGQSATVYIDDIGGSASATLKTGKGTFTITAIAVNASDAGYNLIDGQSASTTVTVAVPETNNGGSGSSGNTGGGNAGSGSSGGSNIPQYNPPVRPVANLNLNSLSVENGKLEPEFSNDVNEYSVSMPKETKEIIVNIVPADSSVQITGNGSHEVKAGDNVVELTVYDAYAQAKRVIKLNVYVEEVPEVYVSFGKDELGVYPSFKGAPEIKDFINVKITINKKEVNALKNEKGLILLYMQNEEGEKDYYVYDSTKKYIVAKYSPITINGKFYIPVSVSDELNDKNGFLKTTVKLGDIEIAGLKYENEAFKNFYLVYLMDEAGKINVYQYEITEESLQLYDGGASVLQTDYDQLVLEHEKLTAYFYIVCGVASFSVILVIVLAVCLKREKKKEEKYEQPEVLEEQKK